MFLHKPDFPHYVTIVIFYIHSSSTPSVTDQRQKAKDLAEEDRRKAVVNRKAAGRKE